MAAHHHSTRACSRGSSLTSRRFSISKTTTLGLMAWVLQLSILPTGCALDSSAPEGRSVDLGTDVGDGEEAGSGEALDADVSDAAASAADTGAADTGAADTGAAETLDVDTPEVDAGAPDTAADAGEGGGEVVDPGGVWVPPGAERTFVVNPTWETSSGGRPSAVSYLPGCIDMQWSEPCIAARHFVTPGGELITLEQGLILSLRFRSNNITERVERFQLASGSNNGNLGWTVTLSVSEAWADFDVDPRCIQVSNTKPEVYVSTDTAETRWLEGLGELPNTHCVVEQGRDYYINLRFETGCDPGDVTCRLRVQVPDGFR